MVKFGSARLRCENMPQRFERTDPHKHIPFAEKPLYEDSDSFWAYISLIIIATGITIYKIWWA